MSRPCKSILGAALTAMAVCTTSIRSVDAGPVWGPQTNSGQDLYMVCAFYPKRGACDRIYQQAMTRDDISTQAVKAEYNGYVRYLTGKAALTDTDRQWLKENGILMPAQLSPDNQAGLHNVINDKSLNPESRRAAVNNFLGRAVQAELYCRFNNCENDNSAEPSAQGPGV